MAKGGVAKAVGDLRLLFDVDALEVPDRVLYDASKNAFRAVGAVWDAQMKMRHFEEAAAARYHYTPRTKSYEARKLREKNESRPLVYSRETMKAARQKTFALGYPTRVRVSLPTPSYINMQSRPRPGGKGQSPPMGDEMTRTTQDEAAALETVYRESVEVQIQAYMEKKGNWQGLALRMANAQGS